MTVILRKLTKKSRLDFGKHNGASINDFLTSRSVYRKDYLYWIYYNCSNLSFIDEILNELGITNDYIIKKPGTDVILFHLLDGLLFNRRKSNRVAGDTYHKDSLKIDYRTKKYLNNRDVLTRYNHGHKTK